MIELENRYYMDLIPRGVFPKLGKENLANGKQAECVKIARYPNTEKDCILKICGDEKGFLWEEAEILVAEANAYREDLIEAGVRIPINHRLGIVQSKIPGSYKILIVDEFEGDGQDLKQKLLSSARETQLLLVGKMMQFLSNLPSGDYEFYTQVLGDFKPENWVLADDGGLILIDYFGPKRWKDGVCYPYLSKMDPLLTQDALTFLCGDRRGQMGRLLAIIHRSFPELADAANVMTLEIIGKAHPEVLPFLKEEVLNGFVTIDGIYKLKQGDWQDKV